MATLFDEITESPHTLAEFLIDEQIALLSNSIDILMKKPGCMQAALALTVARQTMRDGKELGIAYAEIDLLSERSK